MQTGAAGLSCVVLDATRPNPDTGSVYSPVNLSPSHGHTLGPDPVRY